MFIYLVNLFFPSAVNSHADTFFTAINTEILVSPVTVSITSSTKRDIFRRAKLWYLLATLWPARNKAQERQNSLTQLYALKTTKKPPKPCTASHHMEIFIRGTSKGQKGAARHVLTFKWQENTLLSLCKNTSPIRNYSNKRRDYVYKIETTLVLFQEGYLMTGHRLK